MGDQQSTQETLEAILAELQRQGADHRLWNYKDIGYFLGRSPKTIQNNIVSKDDFPKPVKLHRKAKPLWYPNEVKRWIRKQQIR